MFVRLGKEARGRFEFEEVQRRQYSVSVDDGSTRQQLGGMRCGQGGGGRTSVGFIVASSFAILAKEGCNISVKHRTGRGHISVRRVEIRIYIYGRRAR